MFASYPILLAVNFACGILYSKSIYFFFFTLIVKIKYIFSMNIERRQINYMLQIQKVSCRNEFIKK